MSSCLLCSECVPQRPRLLGLSRFAVVLLTILAVMTATTLMAQVIGPSSSDLLEDRIEKLVPKQARSEADEDQLMAEALFAHQGQAAAMQFGHLEQDVVNKLARNNGIELLGLDLPLA